MTGMGMPPQDWYGATVGYLVMWMAMMVPMMLPALVPMLSRYRRSVRGVDGIHVQGLTAIAAVGYFTVWGVLGAAISATEAGLVALEVRWGAATQWLPLATGLLLLLAGGVQLTAWKARQLALCREAVRCGRSPASDAHPLGAWRRGITLGIRCCLCCGGLMLALLATGMMDLAAVVAATLAISAERLAPRPLLVARVVGAAIVAGGLLTITQA